MRTARNRTFYETENGTLGIGPPEVAIGDKVCYLIGYPGFFVLQRIEEHYILKGECCLAELNPGSSIELEELRSTQIFEIH
jgi:hypothetical protein